MGRWAFEEGQPLKFSVTALIPKTDTSTMNRIRAAQKAAIELGIQTKWKGKRPAALNDNVKDGDEMDAPECHGCWVVRLASKDRPGVVDANLNPITDPSEVYSGCYGRVSMNFFPYSASGNNGVSAGLNNVQKTRDGESLGGRARADEDFDVYGAADAPVDDLFG